MGVTNFLILLPMQVPVHTKGQVLGALNWKVSYFNGIAHFNGIVIRIGLGN
jgi:hypothetical protein